MATARVAPDLVTYNTVLKACACGNFDIILDHITRLS